MAATQDFNSSDIEIDEPPVNKFARAGFASIQKMQENQFKDRAHSKKQLKTLTDQRGAPSTQQMRQMTMNRFDAFRATSRNPPDGPPTGDELIRFVETVVRNMKSRYGEGHAISEYTIRGSISLLVDGLSFRYPDYRMTNGEAKRLDSCIARLRQEGKLIKGARKQGCFVGLILLRNMARAWIEDGLENGCRSWDIHISRLLSIVLMHACCSRAGDIALSQHYEGKACLLYEHIEVIVEKQPCLENVIMRVSLHYAKGEKDRPHEARTHIVRQYEAPELFAIDAVKLLLIHALRQGACASQKDPNSPLTTLDEVLQQAFLRRDHKVVWQIPQRPVICGIEQHGFLSADIPARTQQLRATIQDMGLKAGVCQKLSSHAVRYGSARDLAHVPAEAFPLTSAEHVARALGHSRKALHAGVTEMYMGGLGVDTTTARASHPFQDPFAPPVADESMKKKRRRKNSPELTSWCQERGLDPSSQSNRRKAARALFRSEFDAWKEEAVKGPIHKSTSNRTGQDTLGTTSGITPTEAEASGDNIKVPNVERKETTPSNIDPALLMTTEAQTGKISGYDQIMVSDDEDGDSVEAGNDNVDLQMTMMSQFEDLIGCGTGSSHYVPKDDQEMQFLAGTSSSPTPGKDNAFSEPLHLTDAEKLATADIMYMEPESQQFWTQMSGEEFIRFFARINIVLCQRVALEMFNEPQRLYNSVATGNSRDPPTLYEFRCKTKFVDGSVCDYKHPTRRRIDSHVSRCDPTKPPAKLPPPALVCPHGCGKAYSKYSSLATHITSHTKSTQACEYGCNGGKPYANYGAYIRHKMRCHDPSWVPSKCKVAGCILKVFNSADALKEHLRLYHGFNADKVAEYVPRKQPKRKLSPPESDESMTTPSSG